MEKYKLLFSPLRIQAKTLKNRITSAAMTLNWVESEGFANKRLTDYYTNLARGGAGLIIVEATSISYKRRSPFNRTLAIFNDRFIPGLKQLVNKIHNEGSLALLQLHDCLVSTEKSPEDLTKNEIKEIKNDFISAALRAQKSNFDGVEIHMVHRGTLADFLSKKTNKRVDSYGGDTLSRSKLAVEVLLGIKNACGNRFLTSCRLLADEFIIGGNTPEDSKKIAKILEMNGTDVISLSAGGRVSERSNNLTKSLPDEYSFWRAWPTFEWPNATNAYLGEEIKKAVNIPIMIAGKIGDPYVAEEVLATSKADIIAMGRAIVADPYLPRKIKEGKWDEVIKCKYCKHCRRVVRAGLPLDCILWG